MENYIVETQRLIGRLFVNPDPVDPYRFDGVSYAPQVMDRVMRTSADVVRVIAQAEAVRGMGADDVARAVCVGLDEVEEFERSGNGRTASLLAVMEALGVNPVTVPYLRM